VGDVFGGLRLSGDQARDGYAIGSACPKSRQRMWGLHSGGTIIRILAYLCDRLLCGSWTRLFRRSHHEIAGQGAIEYVLLILGVVFFLIVVAFGLRDVLSQSVAQTNSFITCARDGPPDKGQGKSDPDRGKGKGPLVCIQAPSPP
jgi:hypothetical protein